MNPGVKVTVILPHVRPGQIFIVKEVRMPNVDATKNEFTIKDGGARTEFSSGMVRDTAEGKTDWELVFNGPMLERWAIHLTKGNVKYPDPEPGKANWQRAAGVEEMVRFRKGAARHFAQWMRGDRDEDHASACFFNINGAEYVREKLLKIGGETCETKAT